MGKKMIIPSSTELINVSWIGIKRTSGISISFMRGDERRVPSIKGTFDVRIQKIGVEERVIEGIWSKIIYENDHCVIILETEDGKQISTSRMTPSPNTKLINQELLNMIVDAIQEALVEEKRVLRAALSG